MSTIEKLSILGIRSFGIEADDEQKIKFSSPLSLILGANGCGKTTIIECLKYALTGEMPPGSNKGQSFVNDPNISNSAECLGQVKLMVRNIKGESLTVTRSMKCTMKKSKLSFKTEDATIHFENDGKKDTISKRCIDVNAEMCTAMGVTKAILNNVIFCHQEDSSWPLDEQKKLKEKFDAIFGTTEYNKAIDKIMKIRKNYMSQKIQKELSLKDLQNDKKNAETKGLELETAQKKLSKLQANFDKYDEDLKPIEERLLQIRKVEIEISSLCSQKVALTSNLENCQKQQESLKRKIKNIHSGTISSIDREIKNFKETLKGKTDNLNQLEIELNAVKSKERKLQSQIAEMNRKRDTLIYQRQQEQDLFSERATKLQEICNELQINIGDIDLKNRDSQTIDSVVDDIKSGFQREEKLVSGLESENDKIDHQMQQEINKLNEKRAAIESNITALKKQIEERKREAHKNQTEIDAVERSADTLRELTKKIEIINAEFEEFNKNVNLDKTKSSIDQKKINRDKLQKKMDDMDKQITFLNSIANLTAEISVKKKQLESREIEVRRVKNKHSDSLKQLFPERSVETDYKRSVQMLQDKFQREIKTLTTNSNRQQLKMTELQTVRKNQLDELNRYNKELRESEERVFDLCETIPYEEVLERLKENIEKIQLERGALKSAEVFYKKYINKMEQDPCCPLCHKDMTDNEVTDLSTELKDEIRCMPENIERSEKLLQQEERKREALLALQPITEKIEQLKIEIPNCENALKQTETRLKGIRIEVDSLEVSMAEPSANQQLAGNMIGDMSLLDDFIKDANKIRAELEKLKMKLPENIVTTSMEDLQLERATLSGELKFERDEIDHLQSTYNSEMTKLNTLRETRNTMKDKQIKLQEGVQALSQLKTRQSEILEQIEKTILEVNNAERELIPLRNELDEALERKRKIKEDNRKKLIWVQSKLNRLKQLDSEVQITMTALNKLAELNLANAVERLKDVLKRAMEDQKETGMENENLAKKIDKLKSEISDQGIIERDLIDNRELKHLELEEKDHQQKLDDLLKDIGDLDVQKVIKEKTDFVQKQNQIQAKRSELIGQMAELKTQVTSITKELNQSRYKDSIKNYRFACYEVEVIKKIITDLGQYRVALEWALLKYHAEKMERINTLVRELWRDIYRGNDIDYIQIRTDESMASDSNSEKRRNYNYRVVQCKNGVEIDMRGRCSAGQRVLASLIIRMALAETFSSNCGVLALDEPTTNLDRVNIASLCDALRKIVEERQSQSNFMLIVITHDEEFVSALGKVECFYKLSRNEKGKSIIQKYRV